nr:MAG TPA: hypothetical protein [Microviridae sp.]
MSFLGSAAGAFAGGISSIIGGALSNSAARHAANNVISWLCCRCFCRRHF